MKNYLTEQEIFWAGSFGDDYISRNDGEYLLASNLNFFVKALDQAGKITSCHEFGANIGMNLMALKKLFPDINLSAVEINLEASKILSNLIGEKNVYSGSIFDYPHKSKHDLVLIKGVLIHINPEMLTTVYQKLYESSKKYILICEYYNPSPISIDYRGHSNKLFKRDFAGEMMDLYKDLELVDYGFSYRRDKNFPQDDITWFLIKKRD